MRKTNTIQVGYNSPNPPWFCIAYTIFSLKRAGLSWYRVGNVNSRAHVDAVGNMLLDSNLRAGSISNPIGGNDSAPVKKESTVLKGTLSASPI